MKKTAVIVAMMIMVMIAASSTYAQDSKIYSGDKSYKEIKESNKIFKKLLKDLKNQKNDMEKSRDRVAHRYTSSGDDYYGNQVVQLDSMLNLYKDKIMSLESQVVISTVNAAGKDKLEYANLTGKPIDVANAFLLIEYGKKMLSNGTTSARSVEKADSTSMIGIIVNEWRKSVVVRVVGPGNFVREFKLDAYNGKAVFKIPYPGNYLATFSSTSESKSITKPVGPNIAYEYKGKWYDYMSSLPSEF